MPGFSRARLDHFEAVSPYDDYCGMCVQVYGKQSGAAKCSDCGQLRQKREYMATIEESQEATEPQLVNVSHKPTPEEVEAHNATHMPYRSWCKYCVAGKADADPHKHAVEEKSSEVPIVSMDYCFMSGSAAKPEAEEEETEEDDEEYEREVVAKGMPILVMKDRRHKYVFASVVLRKGAHAYAVKRVGQDIVSIL